MKKKKLNKYIVNKLNKIMLRSYTVSFEEMNDAHWALGKQN